MYAYLTQLGGLVHIVFQPVEQFPVMDQKSAVVAPTATLRNAVVRRCRVHNKGD
jgi:hypothetical protein